MTTAHASIIAIGIVIGCGLIAGSNLLFSRCEYGWHLSGTPVYKFDKMRDEVFIHHKDRGWVQVQ
jgi:hypothetical protein